MRRESRKEIESDGKIRTRGEGKENGKKTSINIFLLDQPRGRVSPERRKEKYEGNEGKKAKNGKRMVEGRGQFSQEVLKGEEEWERGLHFCLFSKDRRRFVVSFLDPLSFLS